MAWDRFHLFLRQHGPIPQRLRPLNLNAGDSPNYNTALSHLEVFLETSWSSAGRG